MINQPRFGRLRKGLLSRERRIWERHGTLAAIKRGMAQSKRLNDWKLSDFPEVSWGGAGVLDCPKITCENERDKALARVAELEKERTDVLDRLGTKDDIALIRRDLAAVTERAEKAESRAKDLAIELGHSVRESEAARAEVERLKAQLRAEVASNKMNKEGLEHWCNEADKLAGLLRRCLGVVSRGSDGHLHKEIDEALAAHDAEKDGGE